MGGIARETSHRGRLMESGLRIRSAVEADLAEIERIEKLSFADPWSVSDFRSVMNISHAIFLVAVDQASSDLAGYVVTLAIVDESEVLNIAVDPAKRGGSIGARLLDAALAVAESKGASATFLEVRESNAAARRLYESRGFEEISRRRKYYRSPVEDALVLRRALQR